MKKQCITSSDTRRIAWLRRRSGTGAIDVFVSLTLLATAMTVATPLIVRHGRLLKSQRNYRLALDELSNQLDRLTALQPGELPSAVQRLSPSAFVAERLPGAKLAGETTPAEVGARVTLELLWNESPGTSASASLAAWVFPSTPLPGSAPEEAAPQ
jgi:hypothetical protein